MARTLADQTSLMVFSASRFAQCRLRIRQTHSRRKGQHTAWSGTRSLTDVRACRATPRAQCANSLP